MQGTERTYRDNEKHAYLVMHVSRQKQRNQEKEIKKVLRGNRRARLPEEGREGMELGV